MENQWGVLSSNTSVDQLNKCVMALRLSALAPLTTPVKFPIMNSSLLSHAGSRTIRRDPYGIIVIPEVSSDCGRREKKSCHYPGEEFFPSAAVIYWPWNMANNDSAAGRSVKSAQWRYEIGGPQPVWAMKRRDARSCLQFTHPSRIRSLNRHRPPSHPFSGLKDVLFISNFWC